MQQPERLPGARAAVQVLVEVERGHVGPEVHLEEPEHLVDRAVVRQNAPAEGVVLGHPAEGVRLVLEDRRVPDAEVATDRDVGVDLAVEGLRSRRDRQQLEVVLDVVGVDVREGSPLAAARLVRVARAALRPLAHHEVGLRCCARGEKTDQAERQDRDAGQAATQLFVAHSVTHCRMAAMLSGVRHLAPFSGAPGHPCGICSPAMLGPPSIFRMM